MKVFPLKIKNGNTKNWFLNNTIIYLIKNNFLYTNKGTCLHF